MSAGGAAAQRNVLHQERGRVGAAAEQRRRLAVDRQPGERREATAFGLDHHLHALVGLRAGETRAQQIPGGAPGLAPAPRVRSPACAARAGAGRLAAAAAGRREAADCAEAPTHACVRCEGGSRRDRLEPGSRAVMGCDQPRLGQREPGILEQRMDHRGQRIEAQRGESSRSSAAFAFAARSSGVSSRSAVSNSWRCVPDGSSRLRPRRRAPPRARSRPRRPPRTPPRGRRASPAPSRSGPPASR